MLQSRDTHYLVIILATLPIMQYTHYTTVYQYTFGIQPVAETRSSGKWGKINLEG